MTTLPNFKHVKTGPRQSPVEIKEKMRKNYKAKVQNCRGMLMDKLRSCETDLHATLNELYKSMFNLSDEHANYDEFELMDEIKNELVQEELEWCTKEWEQSQMLNVDWSSYEERNVICPVCQKVNLQLSNGKLQCMSCNIAIPTQSSLAEIEKSILESVDNHNSLCNSNVQFVVVENSEPHVCLLCETCSEMKLVI